MRTASSMHRMPDDWIANTGHEHVTDRITCDWSCFSAQLLNQWHHITRQELEYTRHNRRAIAELIERKYGVDALLVENYLRNVERTLPLLQ